MQFKNQLRNAAVKTPVYMHKLATQAVVSKITRHIMSESEVVECEKNSEKKSYYVDRYCKKFPKVSRALDTKIHKFIDGNDIFADMDPEKLECTKIDIKFSNFAYGTQVDEYVFLDYYNTIISGEQRREFVSDTEQHIVRLCCNDLTHAELSDKASAYEKLGKWYKREVLVIEDKDDKKAYYDFTSRNTKFVLKHVYSSRGKGVELIDSTVGNNKLTFEDLLKEQKVLLEEVIEQSDEVAEFNRDSVNTARVSTFLTKDGVVAPWGFFRTGRKGSFIDNCAAGGVFASIDTSTGKLKSVGCDEAGYRYELHPDSRIAFEGFVLPEWDSAISLCKEAALETPQIKYISWDLAHSKKYGWEIVEVNTCGQFLQQVGLLKGIKKDLKYILNNMDLLIPYTFIRE